MNKGDLVKEVAKVVNTNKPIPVLIYRSNAQKLMRITYENQALDSPDNER